MRYIYEKTGEEIKPERWQWGVVYSDGTELKQFDDAGKYHQIGEVEQERIAVAVLFCAADPKKRIDIPWRPGMRLVHQYKRYKLAVGSPRFRETTVYVFGYKLDGRHSLAYVMPDDRVLLVPDDAADIPQI